MLLAWGQVCRPRGLLARTTQWKKSKKGKQKKSQLDCESQKNSSRRFFRVFPLWATHLSVGLDNPHGSLPTQNILWNSKMRRLPCLWR